MRSPRVLFRIGLLLVALGYAPVAHAEPVQSKVVVVVTVAPDAGELDASKLREAIGSELGADAVAPGDARAAQATGAIDVSVDHDAHQLVVSYRRSAEPIVRRIDLPRDGDSAQHEAVLLAGNLARDEAGDLVAQLRKANRTASVAPPAASPDKAPSEDDAEVQKLDRLGRTLQFYAREGHGAREVLQWTMMGLGFGALGGSVALEVASSRNADAGLFLIQIGETLFASSLLIRPPQFDGLTQYYASARTANLPPAVIREDVEHAWKRVADAEHYNRRLFGWVLTGVSGATLGLYAAGLVAYSVHPSQWTWVISGPNFGWAAVFGFDLAMGTYLLTSDGGVESALHAYEASEGRRIRRGSPALRPSFALAPQGGIFSLSGQF